MPVLVMRGSSSLPCRGVTICWRRSVPQNHGMWLKVVSMCGFFTQLLGVKMVSARCWMTITSGIGCRLVEAQRLLPVLSICYALLVICALICSGLIVVGVVMCTMSYHNLKTFMIRV